VDQGGKQSRRRLNPFRGRGGTGGEDEGPQKKTLKAEKIPRLQKIERRQGKEDERKGGDSRPHRKAG